MKRFSAVYLSGSVLTVHKVPFFSPSVSCFIKWLLRRALVCSTAVSIARVTRLVQNFQRGIVATCKGLPPSDTKMFSSSRMACTPKLSYTPPSPRVASSLNSSRLKWSENSDLLNSLDSSFSLTGGKAGGNAEEAARTLVIGTTGRSKSPTRHVCNLSFAKVQLRPVSK